MRTLPTEKQASLLRTLAAGSALVYGTRREIGPMLRRNWVTARERDNHYAFVRITGVGLRALALHVDERGLPELDGITTRTVRVCDECGSHRIRTHRVELDRGAQEGVAA